MEARILDEINLNIRPEKMKDFQPRMKSTGNLGTRCDFFYIHSDLGKGLNTKEDLIFH